MEQISSAKLEFLNDDVAQKQEVVAELTERYGPKHPKMINAKAELESARKRLKEASKRIVQESSKQFELGKLEREVAANRKLYESFLNKFEVTDISSRLEMTNARIIDEAKIPSTPFKPQKSKLVLQWGMIGLIFGFLFALSREYLHNNFQSAEDIERKLALPVLGVVPSLGKKEARASKSKTNRREKHKHGLVERHYLSNSRSAFSEAINHIRTGVQYSDVDNPPQTILVTSSVQSEGKTAMASNLALSFAHLGRTLLIDADLRRSRVEQFIRGSNKGGLVEFVAGARLLKECVVRDPKCPSLYILKAGVRPPNPLELLSSQRLARALLQLREKFSHIVIDTAPILPVSDAIVLGHIVDAMLFVVQAERASTRMVRDALRKLDNAGIGVMGAVLTQVQARHTAYYYDGKYQYHYGGYYSAEDTSV